MANVKGYVRAADLIRQERAAGEIMHRQIEEFKAYAEKQGWKLEFVDDEILVDTETRKEDG
jgi:DNA invertase Pin-like site-specific DNA recombinase